MDAVAAMRGAMEMARFVTNEYLSDLSDADLLVRPIPEMNHIAWQLGHLICSEREMISALGHKMPELPAGFAEAHNKDAAKVEERGNFVDKATYAKLAESIRQATFQALQRTPAADFDKPAPEAMRSYAPTVGAVFNLIGGHEMMHVGQYVATRRKLGKPIKM